MIDELTTAGKLYSVKEAREFLAEKGLSRTEVWLRHKISNDEIHSFKRPARVIERDELIRYLGTRGIQA